MINVHEQYLLLELSDNLYLIRDTSRPNQKEFKTLLQCYWCSYFVQFDTLMK